MNLPKKDFKVKIGPFNWDVEYREKECDTKEQFGLCDCYHQRIVIDSKIPLQKQHHTFLHEAMHAFCWVTGLAYEWETLDPKNIEEAIVSRLSVCLYQFISDNPKLFKEP